MHGLCSIQCEVGWRHITDGSATGKDFAPGYDGFVELSREMMKGRSSKQQQEAVSGVLRSLMPEEAAKRFRKWFPVSQVGLKLMQLSYVKACVCQPRSFCY